MVDDKRKPDFAPKSARQPIKNWPVTERPREKLLQLGPEGLSDGELLAVLLRIGKSNIHDHKPQHRPPDLYWAGTGLYGGGEAV